LRSPLEPFVPPSQARTDVPPELDSLLMLCLATDPEQRLAKPEQLMEHLLPLCAEAPEPAAPDFSMEVEVDVDVAHSLRPNAPRKSSLPPSLPPIDIAIGTVPPPSVEPPSVKAKGADSPPPPPVPAAARAPMPPPSAAGPRGVPLAAPAAPPPAPANDNLADKTARLTQNDAPRWMAVKDGMDHGPFTARELIKLIVDGEILEQHLVFTLSSPERKPLASYPEFADFIQQYKIRKDEKDHGEALAHSNKMEKRSTAAKALILSASIGAVLVVGIGYMMSRRAAEKAERKAEIDLAALYENGQVKISGTAGILQHTPRPAGARRPGGGSPSPGGGTGFASYEDAMNQAMEIDMKSGGGERQLTSADVAGVMNKSLNRMFTCVGDELRHGGKLGKVTIDVAILGSGKVMGASVNAGSPGFQKCIAAKVRELQFPNFPAPRMGARYSFAVD
jgi:hypothetical protein